MATTAHPMTSQPASIPMQNLTPSTTQTSGSQNDEIAIPPPQSTIASQEPVKQGSPKRTAPATNITIACAALLTTLVFGAGAWIGQQYANDYTRKSYELSLWQICADHPDIQKDEPCISRLQAGVHFHAARDDFLLEHAHRTPFSFDPDDPDDPRYFTTGPGYSPTGFFPGQTSPLRLQGCSAFGNLQPAASFCGQTSPPELPGFSAFRNPQSAAPTCQSISEFTSNILDLLGASWPYVRQNPLDVAIPTVIICTAVWWEFTRQLKGQKATDTFGRILFFLIIVTALSNRIPFVHMVGSVQVPWAK